jgi:LPXTG-site transpeptidase (sortase) family protein
MRYLAYLFIILGLFCYGLGSYQIWLKNDPNRLAFTNYTSEQSSTIDKKDLPVRVTIKNINIDLPIIPADMQGTRWTVTEKGASYLTSSPIPGNTGNSIIYAHNWASLFGNLPRVKKGDIVEVEFADKSTKRFVIASTTVVFPTDAKVLAGSQDKKITLYTCTGFLDSKRFVAVGTLDDQLAKK